MINPDKTIEIFSYKFGYKKTIIYNFDLDNPSREYETSVILGPLGESSLSSFLIFILLVNISLITLFYLRKKKIFANLCK